MHIVQTEIPNVLLIEPRVFRDHRGFFLECFRSEEFVDAGLPAQFVQDNHSHSSKGVLRGLHYQYERPQGKLVNVIAGEIFDVAVDLRSSSPTFGKWIGRYLSARNPQLLWIPPEFAHGFVVLSDEADVVYKTTGYYDPTSEYCIRWDDPDLAIQWPFQGKPILSKKDSSGGLFRNLPHFA